MKHELDELNEMLPKYLKSSRLASVLKPIVVKLGKMPISALFRRDVDTNLYPTYLNVVSQPMSLQRIQAKIDANQYLEEQQFIDDLQLIVNNSIAFNGINSPITANANSIFLAGFDFLKKMSAEGKEET